jgi:hypothetical protein
MTGEYPINRLTNRNPVYNPLIHMTVLYCVDLLLGNDLKASILVHSRYWSTTSKQTTNQHPLLDNRFLMNKYTQPLLNNIFANKHIPMETFGVQQ